MSNQKPFDTKEYRVIPGVAGAVQKLSLVEMESQRATGLFLFCTSNELPQYVDVLLGNDLCQDSYVTRNMSKQEAETISPVTKREYKTEIVGDIAVENDTGLHLNELFDGDLSDMKNKPEVKIDFDPDNEMRIDNINLRKLIELQKADLTLAFLYNLTETEHVNGTCFFLRENLLCRKWRNPKISADVADDVIQIVVPKCMRLSLLQVAHDIPASSHFGVTKTFARLSQSFY